jgi:hypothetical protein
MTVLRLVQEQWERKLIRSLQPKSYPCTDVHWPLGLQEVEVPRISRQSAHEGGMAVRPTHRPPWPPWGISTTHFWQRPKPPHGHSAAGRIKSMKNEPTCASRITMSWANVWMEVVVFGNESAEIAVTSYRMFMACNSLSPFTSSDRAPM